MFTLAGCVNIGVGVSALVLTIHAEVIWLAEVIQGRSSQRRGIKICVRQFRVHIHAGRIRTVVGISQMNPAPMHFLVIPTDVRLAPLGHRAEGAVSANAYGDVLVVRTARAPGEYSFLILNRSVVNPQFSGARARAGDLTWHGRPQVAAAIGAIAANPKVDALDPENV